MGFYSDPAMEGRLPVYRYGQDPQKSRNAYVVCRRCGWRKDLETSNFADYNDGTREFPVHDCPKRPVERPCFKIETPVMVDPRNGASKHAVCRWCHWVGPTRYRPSLAWMDGENHQPKCRLRERYAPQRTDLEEA